MKIIPVQPVTVELPSLEERSALVEIIEGRSSRIEEVKEDCGEGSQKTETIDQAVKNLEKKPPLTTTSLLTPLSAAVWFAHEEAARAVNLMQWGGKIGICIGCLLSVVYHVPSSSPIDWLLQRILLGTLFGGVWGTLIGNWLTPSVPQRKAGSTLLSYLAALGESIGRKIGKEYVPGAITHFRLKIGTYVPFFYRLIDNWELQAPRADLFIRAYLRHRDPTFDRWPAFFCASSGHLCFYPVRIRGKVYEHFVIAEDREFQGEEVRLDLELIQEITTEFVALIEELDRVKKQKLGKEFPCYGIIWDRSTSAGVVDFEYYMYLIPRPRQRELIVPDGEARIGTVDEQQIAVKMEHGGVEALTVAEIDFILWCCQLYAHVMSERNSNIKDVLCENIDEFYSVLNWSSHLVRKVGDEGRKDLKRLDRWQHQSWATWVGAQQVSVKPLQQFLHSHFGHGLDLERIEQIKRNMYDLLQRMAADARNNLPDATTEVWACRIEGHNIKDLCYGLEGYYVDKEYSRRITDFAFLERYLEERKISDIVGKGGTVMMRDSHGRNVPWLVKMAAEYPMEFDFAQRVWQRMYRQKYSHARGDHGLGASNVDRLMYGHLTTEGRIVLRRREPVEEVFRQRLCQRLYRALQEDKEHRRHDPNAPLTCFVHNEVYEHELACRQQGVLLARVQAIAAGAGVLFSRNIFSFITRISGSILQRFS